MEELQVWQVAHKITRLVYRCTEQFPRSELFGLVSQMRRASVSMPANIAEGFGRYSLREKCRFYDIARGSLEEVAYYIRLTQELGYLTKEQSAQLTHLCIEMRKTLTGSIKALKKKQQVVFPTVS